MRDQGLGPDATSLRIEEAAHAAPFYVVAFEGDATAIGPALGSTALLPAGEHTHIDLPLPRPAADGERLWIALHLEASGNSSFDGPSVDPALTEGVAGSRGPQGQVAVRIAVNVGAPTPPVSGGQGLADHARSSGVIALALVAATLTFALAVRRRTRA